ncbi:MAG: hypothetical protein MK172_13915, partial [Verrucomicrobiales bacterium]|nr:hypothetical protein [Verrucomicrobiales bacterium]
AESLSKHEGEHLWLTALTKLSDAAAESLSKHEGSLYLSGLIKLSDAAAESLSRHKGDLFLESLAELSTAAAESLSRHEGDLVFDSLTELSDAAAESLSKHKGKINDQDPKKWIDSLHANKGMKEDSKKTLWDYTFEEYKKLTVEEREHLENEETKEEVDRWHDINY